MSEYQIVEYNETAAALAVLREKYCTVFDVQTPKGLAAAREARAEVRSYRVSLEKLRVEIKAPALERIRLIDAEAKRITAALLEIEEPIDAAIKAEETRKAEERAAKERAEAARIAEIRHCYTNAVNKTAAEIMTTIEQVETMELQECDFEELLQEANAAQDETAAKAKAKNGRKKAVTNPLQELESAINVGMPISAALKTAYEIGYEDGIKAAQVAA